MELKKGETIMTNATLHLPAAFLHEAFSNRSGVPPDHFGLYYRGKRLEGEAVLASYGIGKDATIEVKMRGLGGMQQPMPRGGSPHGGRHRQIPAQQQAAVGTDQDAADAAAKSSVVLTQRQTDQAENARLKAEIIEEETKIEQAQRTKELVARMKNKGIGSDQALKAFSIPEIELMLKEIIPQPDKEALVQYIASLTMAHDVVPEDDDLPTIKARTMYKMVEDVEESKAGIKTLLFLSSKQANLIARDPSAIDKMLAIFVDKQQPRMVINLLPSMIRCWTRVRPLLEDPDGEREGLAALDRFMAEHIIPLAAQTHAIILCSAVQPFCVLSESLSRMLKLVRSRWGNELPFTIISCTGELMGLYTVKRLDTAWREIRNLSRVWKKREKEGRFADAVKAKLEKNSDKQMGVNFDMDLDPNGTNFIIVDPTSSSATHDSFDSYNRLITEIVRKLAAEFPSIAIQTGKSKFSNLAETNASGIEVALSNMEAGTPVLLLDLTKRDMMPAQLPLPVAPEDGDVGKARLAANEPKTTVAPADGDGGPAARRRQQIEWHREMIENEEQTRVERNLPDYDWDVCMIAHFHDGAHCSPACCAHRTHRTHHTLATRTVLF